ncbi:SRPBCC family protein [Moheibacter sediminis]|uniref:Uncharacterized conserved protein YndB, AHSA1/START domain n=1 Tax=Moheibacter sediminis TaxID=1434700 RepID=A0A1W2AG92_9FLAO|nr:SRPBCC family protein [Moheibacter sediminis]SMC59707.1 Uncharacterized conserved protein YndB, AHSA1/START domain [Moheibacter sediminis]
MENQKITVAADVQAPIEKVWNAYTQPQHITKWNQASEDWCCPHAENDVKVGGKYNARMEAKDGSFGFDFEAIYDEIVDRKKLSYNMLDGRNATIEFISDGNQTKVTTTFDPENQNPIEMQQDGWQAIMNSFKNYVERIS